MEENAQLDWPDIVVFTSVLVISAAIGLIYAIRARKSSAEELTLGQRKLPLWPVIFSLSVSFVSAVSVLGVASEVYTNGSEYWIIGFGYIWSLALTCFIVVPIIYNLKLTSAYEYLELRFSRPIRLMASGTFIFMMICYMSVVLYAPALALSSVTALSMEISILAMGLVCTFYTALGGIKAVIWTDVFQMFIMTAGLLALIGRGTVEVGGVAEVVHRVVNGSRDATFRMDLNPFIRHTFWTLTVGGGFGIMAISAANQASLQRYMGVRSLCQSKMVVLVNLPLSEFYLALMVMSGLVMYAYYQGRDPLSAGRIKMRDQLLPLFVMDILGDLPGMPGLFIASIFSAALSTVSSGVNSLATVTVEDFVNPVLMKVRGSLPSSRIRSIIIIGTALLYGLITIGTAYLAGILSSTLVTIVVSIFGMLGGPLLGLMLLGILCPWVNSYGAGSALVSSLAMCMWTAIGAITSPRPLSVPTNGTVAVVSASTQDSDNWEVRDWYQLSYQHYATLGVLVSLLVGTVVSFMTGCNRGRELMTGTYYDWWRPCRRADFQAKDSCYDLKQTEAMSDDSTGDSLAVAGCRYSGTNLL